MGNLKEGKRGQLNKYLDLMKDIYLRTFDHEQNNYSESITRLKVDAFEGLVRKENNGVLTIMGLNKSSCPPMLYCLRPKKLVNDYLESTIS
jgi:predicted translin family RNA/ssDNA-binding protein